MAKKIRKVKKLDEYRQNIQDNIDKIEASISNKEPGMRYLSEYNLTVHIYKFRKNPKAISGPLIAKFFIEGTDCVTDWYEDLKEALQAYIDKIEVGSDTKKRTVKTSSKFDSTRKRRAS